jgi:hypothetical protein
MPGQEYTIDITRHGHHMMARALTGHGTIQFTRGVVRGRDLIAPVHNVNITATPTNGVVLIELFVSNEDTPQVTEVAYIDLYARFAGRLAGEDIFATVHFDHPDHILAHHSGREVVRYDIALSFDGNRIPVHITVDPKAEQMTPAAMQAMFSQAAEDQVKVALDRLDDEIEREIDNEERRDRLASRRMRTEVRRVEREADRLTDRNRQEDRQDRKLRRLRRRGLLGNMLPSVGGVSLGGGAGRGVKRQLRKNRRDHRHYEKDLDLKDNIERQFFLAINALAATNMADAKSWRDIYKWMRKTHARDKDWREFKREMRASDLARFARDKWQRLRALWLYHPRAAYMAASFITPLAFSFLPVLSILLVIIVAPFSIITFIPSVFSHIITFIYVLLVCIPVAILHIILAIISIIILFIVTIIELVLTLPYLLLLIVGIIPAIIVNIIFSIVVLSVFIVELTFASICLILLISYLLLFLPSITFLSVLSAILAAAVALIGTIYCTIAIIFGLIIEIVFIPFTILQSPLRIILLIYGIINILITWIVVIICTILAILGVISDISIVIVIISIITIILAPVLPIVGSIIGLLLFRRARKNPRQQAPSMLLTRGGQRFTRRMHIRRGK